MKTAIRWTLLLTFSVLVIHDAALATGPGAGEDRASAPMRGAVIYDGLPFAPGAFKRPDQALTWVVTKDDAENGTIHAFTSREVAGEFMNRLLDREFGKDRGRDRELATVEACAYPSPWSWFNKNPGCGGSSSLVLYPGDQYTELDSIGWNNTISCVKAACLNAFTTIYSCRNFQLTTGRNCADPDALFIFPGVIIPDLNTQGFNNRTSSIRFCATFPNCT